MHSEDHFSEESLFRSRFSKSSFKYKFQVYKALIGTGIRERANGEKNGARKSDDLFDLVFSQENLI